MKSSTRLVTLLCLLVCLAGFLALASTPLSAVAQGSVSDSTPTATLTESIPHQDRPGDTTVLLLAAGGLILIAVGAVLWHSRSR